jgi:molecular chaperone DnaK (HSP70)
VTAVAVPTTVESPTPAVSAQGTLVEDVGIETLGGVFTPIVSGGCRIPCTSTVVFSTAEDKQPEIKLFLFRGKATMTKDAKPLGTYAVREVPPLPRGHPQIAVTFIIGHEGIALEAIDKQANRPLPIARGEP